MAKNSKKLLVVDEAQQELAEAQIRDLERSIRYNVNEFTVEFLADKVREEEYYVPPYQRHFTWSQKKQSQLIESVMIGLPIPPVFLWIADDGRIEIVDGSQRLRTLNAFKNEEMVLQGLEMLTELEGFAFMDIPLPRRRKFLSRSMRGFLLDHTTTVEYRTEMFQRVNMGGLTLNTTEYRIGALPGLMSDLVVDLAKGSEFQAATPMSASKGKEREREELLFRFFAYTERAKETPTGLDFPRWKDRPGPYINSFVEEYNERLAIQPKEAKRLRTLLEDTLVFVLKAFPSGFAKTPKANSIPRVRFEAIAVGVGILAREGRLPNPDSVNVNSWINGTAFNDVATSGSANVRAKLKARIEFVMERLEPAS